jgi:hypothetical protein
MSSFPFRNSNGYFTQQNILPPHPHPTSSYIFQLDLYAQFIVTLVYKTKLFQRTCHAVSNVGVTANAELEIMWSQVIFARLNMIQHLPGGTEENYKEAHLSTLCAIAQPSVEDDYKLLSY